MQQSALLSELEALMTGHWLTDLSNFSAFFFHQNLNLNWVGFYLSDGDRLRLGPFSGKPACVEIAFDRGVCGAAFRQNQILRVVDVHEFPGHISCDPDSRSELVLPFKVSEHFQGVLDIDSPTVNRFTNEDSIFFEKALGILLKGLKRDSDKIRPFTVDI